MQENRRTIICRKISKEVEFYVIKNNTHNKNKRKHQNLKHLEFRNRQLLQKEKKLSQPQDSQLQEQVWPAQVEPQRSHLMQCGSDHVRNLHNPAATLTTLEWTLYNSIIITNMNGRDSKQIFPVKVIAPNYVGKFDINF